MLSSFEFPVDEHPMPYLKRQQSPESVATIRSCRTWLLAVEIGAQRAYPLSASDQLSIPYFVLRQRL